MIYPFRNTMLSWRPNPEHSGSFTPSGKTLFTSNTELETRLNPTTFSSKAGTWAARVIIGFKYRDTPKGKQKEWTMDQAVDIIRGLRKKQTVHGTKVDPSASFLYQKGVYKSKKTRRLVTENSTQVVFLNIETDIEPPKQFRINVMKLAEEACSILKQEEIIVSFQKGGRETDSYGISARRDALTGRLLSGEPAYKSLIPEDEL